MNRKLIRPTAEQWARFIKGQLPEPESLAIENYVEEFGVPLEFSSSAEALADDSFVKSLRLSNQLNENATIGYQIGGSSGAVDPSESELKKLVEKWPELKSGFKTDSIGRISKVGRYGELVNVSRSRMGSVYRGVDMRTGQSVAIKFPSDSLNANTLERFRREILVTKRLKHPQVVNVIDELQFRGMLVYVMPWVDGVDLGRLLQHFGRLPLEGVAEIGRQVAKILTYLKESHVVHRDIKPSNLILTPFGELKLIDLGLALLNNSEITDETYTESIQIIGSLDYLAPEQARESHSADIRSDIYSLGCTLCKLATGSAPFEKKQTRHALQIILAHSLDPFPDLHLADPSIPAIFSDLLKSMCTKLPGDRLSDLDEIAEMLNRMAVDANLPRIYQSYIETVPDIESTKVSNSNMQKRKRYGQKILISRRSAMVSTAIGSSVLGMTGLSQSKSARKWITDRFQNPNAFLFARKPQQWLNPHVVFVADGNIDIVHVIDPENNFKVTGLTPPYSGWSLAVTRSGKMFFGNSSGDVRMVDLNTNSGYDYKELRLDQEWKGSQVSSSGGMAYVDSRSLYITSQTTGRLYKIDTLNMTYDKSFGEGGSVVVGETARSLDHDLEGNIYVATFKGITKVSSNSRQVDRNFITGLNRSVTLGCSSANYRSLFVGDSDRIMRFSWEGKRIHSKYIAASYEIDSVVVDRGLDLIYLTGYSYIDHVDVYKIDVRGILLRKIPNVGLNLAQMALPVKD